MCLYFHSPHGIKAELPCLKMLLYFFLIGQDLKWKVSVQKEHFGGN